MSDLSAKDMAAVVRTIELLRQDGWNSDKRLADSVQAWLKGKL